jgi:hypothetical protein
VRRQVARTYGEETPRPTGDARSQAIRLSERDESAELGDPPDQDDEQDLGNVIAFDRKSTRSSGAPVGRETETASPPPKLSTGSARSDNDAPPRSPSARFDVRVTAYVPVDAIPRGREYSAHA